MPARTKGRAKFDFRGRAFLWWIEDARYLRIISLDKKFVVGFPLGRAADEPPSLVISGQEFPGLKASESRPVYLCIPDVPANSSIGAWVDHIIKWCFDPAHIVERRDKPPRFS
jgi:hypothetical protein